MSAMRSAGLPVLPTLAIITFGLLPACSGGDGGGGGGGGGGDIETGRVEITLIVPPAAVPAQDPFTGVETFRVTILDSAGGIAAQADFGVNDPIEIRLLDPGADRVVVLEGRNDLLAPVSRGRTIPLDIVEGDTVEATLYFARIGQFATVYGTPAVRTGASTWTFGDGRVLVAGGLDAGGVALASAEVFDWEADTMIAAGVMGTGLAFAPIASLENDTVLLVGGITDSAGAPSASAQVYEHVPGGVGTWATGVPLMPGERREHGAAGLGPGRALVVGGTTTTAALGPALNTTFVFAWDGTSGTWSAGPDSQEARSGPIVLPAPSGVAIVAGGFNNNVGGGNDDFTDDVDVFSWNGAAAVIGAGNPQIGATRGWSGATEVATNQWLVWGGEEGDNNAHNLMDVVELWTWNGTTLSFAQRQDLPDTQRGGAGGRLAGNQVLLLGGNDAEYPASTPKDVALIYDVVSDNFTPLPASPGLTLGGTAAPLPDGTSLVVIDGAVLRFNPL